ncbi:MAG: hypothetical protein ACT6QS_12045 [Flavobacteriales bacterium]
MLPFRYFLLCMLLTGVWISCGGKTTADLQPGPTVKADSVQAETPVLIESFIDSTCIGRRGFNKVELLKYRHSDSVYTIVRFYTLRNRIYIRKNNFRFENDNITGLSTELKDLTADGYKDLTYTPYAVARGANDVRYLFVYSVAGDSLVFIRNSDNYPNLEYNKKLKCLDAWSVYGGSTTSFLRIEGDSLYPFATVTLFDGLEVKTYDTKGNARLIFSDSTEKQTMLRYRNYNPLELAEAY